MEKECREITDRLSAYLDGEVEGQDLEELVRHLEECGCCRHCLAEIKAVRESLRKMPAPEIPRDLKDRLKACLREKKGR